MVYVNYINLIDTLLYATKIFCSWTSLIESHLSSLLEEYVCAVVV
jgi:hypothetical protein